MADDQVSVKIVADASGVAPGVNKAKESVGGLEGAVTDLNATMQAMSRQMAEAMDKMAASTKKVGEGIKHLSEESEAGFRGIIMGVHEGVESFNAFKASLAEIGEVYMAAFAVERIVDWSKEMGEAAEKTKHTAETFGMTVPQVEGLSAAAAASGMSVDTLTKGLGILDKNMISAASGTGTAAIAFKAVGISASDGKTQMQMMLEVANKFKNMDDGPKKVALAMELFGRSGKEMIPFLNMGAQGIEELDQKTQRYAAGVMVATDANKELRAWLDEVNEKGMALAETNNENKIAMQGVSNVMMDAFAPVLKEATAGLNSMIQSFINSYREGGAVKDVLQAVAKAFEAVGAVISATTPLFSALGDAIAFISDNIGTILPVAAALATLIGGPYVVAMTSAAVSTILASDAMAGFTIVLAVDGLMAAVTTALVAMAEGMAVATAATWAFTAALLANPLTWVAVACAAAVAGLVWLAEHFKSCADTLEFFKDGLKIWGETLSAQLDIAIIIMGAFAKAANDAMHLNWGAVQSDWENGQHGVEDRVRASMTRIKALADDAKSHLDWGKGPAEAKHTEEAAPKRGSFDPDLAKPAKQKKAKGGGADNTVQEWQAKLDVIKNGYDQEQALQNKSEDYSLQAELKYWTDKLALCKDGTDNYNAVNAKITAIDQKIAAQNLAAFKKSMDDKLAELKKNTDGQKALEDKALADAEKNYGKQSDEYKAVQDAMQKTAVQAAGEEIRLTEMKAAAEIKAAKVSLAAQESAAKFRVSMGVETQKQMIAQEMQFLAAQKAIDDQALQADIKATVGDRVAHQAAINAKLASDQQYAMKKAQLDQQQLLETTSVYRNIAAQWGDSIGKMVTLQQSFTKTVQSMYMSMVQAFEQMVAKQVTQWLSAEIMKIAASRMGNQQQVGMDAGKAASGAYSAIAGIPVVGPILAPAAAAAAFTAVEAFSAYGGWGDVPYDGAQTTLHAREMVLPANLATPLRSMLTSGNGQIANDHGSNDNSGGDTHVHIHATDADSVKKLLSSEAGIAGIRSAMHKASAGLKS